MTAFLRRLAARFDRVALDQLRADAARLSEENERLRYELDQANDLVTFWHTEAMDLTEELLSKGATVGLAQDGTLHVGYRGSPS